MKFSTRTLYGLKAILVLASRYGEGSLPVSHIAKREHISTPYLEQILNALKRKGFVKSVRGPQGGYVLAKKPSEISLQALFYTLEDKVFKDVNGKSGASSKITDEIGIANLIFWKKFQSSLEQGLGKVTLKDLIDEARRARKSKNSSTHTFHI